MDRILKILKKENGPRASSAPALELNTIIFKHVYWYMQLISGERLQDHWSSGFNFTHIHDASSQIFQESQLTEMNEEAASHDAFRDKSLETFQDTKKPLTNPNLSKILNQTSAIIDKSASTDSVNDHSIINTNSDKDVTQIQTNSSVLGNDLTKSKKKEPPQNHDVPSLSTKVGAISHNSSATSMKQDKNNTLTQNDDTSCLEDDLDMLLSIDKPKTVQKPVLNSQNVNKVHVAKHAFVNGSDKPKGEFYHALQNVPMQYSDIFFRSKN